MITGTSTGIGRACVGRMAADGWTVYAGVRKEADGANLVQAVVGDVRPVQLDVTDAGHISAMVERLRDELGGGLDGLVNNAGVVQGGPIESLSDAAWRSNFDVNVFGLVNVTRECLPLLLAGKGRVVNVGSISGRVSTQLMAPYAAGKHAVEAISEALRFEVADQGVAVACVEPGEVESAIWEKADDQLQLIAAGLPDDVQARYRRHVDMLYGFVADGAKRGIPASRVAKAVHDALTSRRPKHRYLVGPDAKAIGIVSRLPDRVRGRVLAMNAARWERAGRKIRAEG